MFDLGRTLLAVVERSPDALAIVDGERRLSYAAWYREIGRVGGGLTALGLRRRDRLAVMAAARRPAWCYPEAGEHAGRPGILLAAALAVEPGWLPDTQREVSPTGTGRQIGELRREELVKENLKKPCKENGFVLPEPSAYIAMFRR